MKKFFAVIMLLTATGSAGYAQQVWNLRSIVEYAMANNIVIRQTDLQSRQAQLTYDQSKLGRYPTLNLSGNAGITSGTSQDPTTFSRNTEAYFSSGYQLQSSVDIFNFYSKQNMIRSNELEMQAANANTEKLRNDMALTAANSYLQILLAIEQRKIAEVQLAQSKAQLEDIRKRVDAGALPELNATQIEAQVAMDSTNLVTAKGNIEQAILAVKANMSLPADEPFLLDTPDINQIPLEVIANLQPADVYASALQNLPQQRYNSLRLQAADYAVKSAKGQMKPTLGGFASLGTSTSSGFRTLSGVNTITGPDVAIGSVNVQGTSYNVYAPNIINTPVYSTPGYFSQVSDNFRQNIGLSISVPIFQQGILRTNYNRSKLNVESLKLQTKADNLKLKQDIYQAYTAAVVALDKMNASEKMLEANEKAFDFASRRSAVGMLGTFELITQQNNLLNARLQYALNKYDYVFKIKVLEFYKGTGIKL